MNRRFFFLVKTPEFIKMGEIHELFVLALSLIWFAGASPDFFFKIGVVPRLLSSEATAIAGENLAKPSNSF